MINLPSAEKSALPPDDYIQIVLKPDATLSHRRQRQEPASRPKTRPTAPPCCAACAPCMKTNPDYPVMIAGDRESKYDDVIQLISEAKKMGINRVGLATK